MLPGTTPGETRADRTPTELASARRTASPQRRLAQLQRAFRAQTVTTSTGREVKKRPAILNLAVMAIVVPGLFATIALPAYAFQEAEDAGAASAELQALKQDGAQTVAVGEDLVAAAVKRDSYKVTTAAEMQRIALATAYRSYSGPTVGQLLANPPYPNFSLDTVVKVAKKYIGVPYRYGGADPAGFDCSGFTQWVYAHVGVSLPHSSSRQGAGGTPIARADALPGDIVVTDGGGHVGIYLGGNKMIDAPRPGTVVQIRGIYDPNAWFVRYGI